MNRRQLVVRIGAVVLFFPAGRLLLGCSGGNGGNGTDAGPTDAGSQTLIFTTSVEQAHTHTLTLQRSVIVDSPLGGVDADTSTDAGHLHEVSISEAELDSIESGSTVTKTTSLVSGHTHTVELRLMP